MYLPRDLGFAGSGLAGNEDVEGPSSNAFDIRTHTLRLLACLTSEYVLSLMGTFVSYQSQ